jgi:hypothetical protein
MPVPTNILNGVVRPAASQSAFLKEANEAVRGLDAGAVVTMSNGAMFRVASKVSSANGVRFQLVNGRERRTVTAAQVMVLQPLSPAIVRLASFAHLAYSFVQTLDAYVKNAIEKAGLPVDPDMDWGKYLRKVFKSLFYNHQDQTVAEEAVLEVVVRELYDHRCLEADSPYAHFVPDTGSQKGRPLDKQVSAFLSYRFTRKVPDAFAIKNRTLGLNNGDPEHTDPDSRQVLDYDYDFSDGDLVVVDDSTEKAIDSSLDSRAIEQFMDAFKAYTSRRVRANTAKILNLISDMVAAGDDRTEIRERIIDADDLRGRDGQTISSDNFKMIMRSWGKMIREFADSSSNPERESPIAKAIVRGIEEEKPKKTVSARDLKLAEIITDQEQNQAHVAPITNPNVQQQQKLQQTNTNTPPQQQFQQQGEQDFQQPNQQPQQDPQRRTIPPEIPGVNHV